ncbi:MAG: hypothetical protein J6K82_04060 [Alphaproteobacteria bacterium]|nr:hypothetical protein [Alphaproteobacteria bacterium]
MKIITKLFFIGFFCVFAVRGVYAATTDVGGIAFTACNVVPISNCSGVSAYVNTMTFCSNVTEYCVQRSDGTYFKYATCNSCSKGTLTNQTITLPGCSSNATQTIKNCVVSASDCNGTCDGICHTLPFWFETGVDGYDYEQTCSCNTSTCQWEYGNKFRCAAGYYNTSASFNASFYALVNCSVDSSGNFTSCTGCAVCPTMTSGGNTYPGKSDAGIKLGKTECFVGYGDDVKYQDNSGEYTFSQKCKFTN